jgi:hypothetical protein
MILVHQVSRQHRQNEVFRKLRQQKEVEFFKTKTFIYGSGITDNILKFL